MPSYQLVQTIFSLMILRQASNSHLPQDTSATLDKWFGLIFAAEGIGIGIGSGILVALGWRSGLPLRWLSWSVCTFSAGSLLRPPFDYLLGAAIVLVVVITVLFVLTNSWAGVLELGTAV